MRLVDLIALSGALALGVVAAPPAIPRNLHHEYPRHEGHSSPSCTRVVDKSQGVVVTKCHPSSTPRTTTPCSPPATSPPVDMCGKGGECDCSRIPDVNSDEFFQCVTNPNCEHCWITPWPPSPESTSAAHDKALKVVSGKPPPAQAQPSAARGVPRAVNMLRTTVVSVARETGSAKKTP
ncbi:phospholipase D [Purpureocillium lavendulum]|uniref:Phospholipase D n=1 Tax=Purpureocillium lavendulum TaxID=1247861 RepID=A0AB34FSL7_9HYPO|nr:phospholipase D [Purpureocillium lavendulum]